MKKDINVTVIIPVLNSEKTLAALLNSLAGQSYPNFETIVVDNGSTDKSFNIARGNKDVIVISCASRGRSQARNAGAKLARGRILAFVDSDVVLHEDWLKCAISFMSQHHLDIVAGKVIPSDARPQSLLDRYRRFRADYRTQGTFLSVVDRNGAFPSVNSAACVIDAFAFNSVGGFDERLSRGEDYDLSKRLFKSGFLVGGTSSAVADVHFQVEANWPLSREMGYLSRSFASGTVERFHPVSVIYARNRLRQLWKTTRDPVLFAFGLLVEALQMTGFFFGQKFVLDEVEVTQPNVTKKDFTYFFRRPSKTGRLKRPYSFIWIDERAHLFDRRSGPRGLSEGETAQVRKIMRGEELSAQDITEIEAWDVYA